MPNQPKTPLHSVRVPDELWTALKAAAAAEGETVSDVLRDLMREYVDRHARRGGSGGSGPPTSSS